MSSYFQTLLEKKSMNPSTKNNSGLLPSSNSWEMVNMPEPSAGKKSSSKKKSSPSSPSSPNHSKKKSSPSSAVNKTLARTMSNHEINPEGRLPSQRHTNNERSRKWRNLFNARIDRAINEIETLKSKVEPQALKHLDKLLESLHNVQGSIEGYVLKNQPGLKKAWTEYIDNMDTNIMLLKIHFLGNK